MTEPNTNTTNLYLIDSDDCPNFLLDDNFSHYLIEANYELSGSFVRNLVDEVNGVYLQIIHERDIYNNKIRRKFFEDSNNHIKIDLKKGEILANYMRWARSHPFGRGDFDTWCPIGLLGYIDYKLRDQFLCICEEDIYSTVLEAILSREHLRIVTYKALQ